MMRRATEADAEAIARVHVDTWRATYAGHIPDEVLAGLSVDERAAMWRRAIAAGRPLWVAGGPEIVGFVYAAPAREAPPGFDGEVRALYVLPEAHGRGVGRALLARAHAQLRADGCARAMLWVLAVNPARGFYERLGGRLLDASKDSAYGDRVLQSVAYGWELAPAR